MSLEERVNILMVDDQPSKLLSYEAILDELGENLIKASSGREALEQLLRTDVAVVLMDVSMPELDGFTLANMIRQHPRFQKTAIIFISAVHLTDIDRLRGYERGAVDYISVPVIPELLRAKVSVFSELHRRARQLERLNGELRRLSSSLIATQDEERRRIARELHDGLGQDLIAAKIMLDVFQQQELSARSQRQAAADASRLIEHAVQQVRSISHLLHPPMLDEVGLHSALQWYLEGVATRSGLETSTNVFRHSGAQKGWVTLVKEQSQVLVTVRDDGKGIPDHVVELRPDSVGIGIGGMRQRVKEFGGELRLQNTSPGTLVEVVIPIPSFGTQVQTLPARP
jgi:signal transduction histidine kinase